MSFIKSQTIKSSILVSFFTAFTHLFNYLTLVLLAFTFGARMEMDAFFAASTVPQVISLILLSTLSVTFIPLFIEVKSTSESEAWSFAGITANLVFLILLGIAVVSSFFSNEIISLIAPGFSEESVNLSASLFRILIYSRVFLGVSVVFQSLYYARKKFFRPSFGQGMSSLFTFFFVIFFRSSLGITSIVVGTLLGSIFQFFWLLPIFLKRGRYCFKLNLKLEPIKRLIQLSAPLLIGALFYRTNTLVERFLASRLGEGNISYLGYAFKVISIIVIVMAQGINTAIFPKMSELSSLNSYKELKEIISKGIRASIIIIVPVTFLIVLVRYDLVRLLFERGNFTSQASQAVSQAVLAYIGVLIFGALITLMNTALYSLQETVKVAFIGIFSFCIYVGLAFFLSTLYSYIGIAVAFSLQYIICLPFSIYFINKKIGKFEKIVIFHCICKTVIAGSFTFILLILMKYPVRSLFDFPFDLFIIVVLGIILYLGFLILFKTEELKYISDKPYFKKTI